MDQMSKRPDRRDRARERDAERDVAHLRDGRIGEPLLDVVLGEGAQGAVDDGDPRRDGERQGHAEIDGDMDAEHLIDHPHDAEGPRLDDGHRMQERGDRRRRDHGDGQPGMEGHQRRLHAEPGDQHEEEQQGLDRIFRSDLRHHAAGGEIGAARHHPEPECSHQQHEPSGERIDQIDPPRAQRLRRAPMDHERIGRDGQKLIEKQEGEQVPRHGDPDRRRDAEAEEAEETRAMRAFLQIADGIDRRDQPENRRQRQEENRQRIGLELELEAGQHGEAHVVDDALADLPAQPCDERDLDAGSAEIDRRAPSRRALRQREEQRHDAERRQKNEQRQQRDFVHGLAPKGYPISMKARIGAAARPSPSAVRASTRGGASAMAQP